MRHALLVVLSLVFFTFTAQQISADITKTLKTGSRGAEVTELQNFLSTYPDVYPEKAATGNFGVKTKAAVKRFQKKHGLKQTGVVDAGTRAKIRELSSGPAAAPVARNTNAGFAPKSPSYSIATPGYTELVAAKGGTVAALSRDRIMQVVDVTNPASPRLESTINTPAFAEAAYQNGPYIYIADSRELRVHTDPLEPPIGKVYLDNWPTAEFVQGGYGYLVSGSELMIVDVRDPKNMKKISRTRLIGQAASEVIVKDDYAYVIETLGGLNVVDIKNPAKPVVVKVLPFESHTVGFEVSGNYAYLGRVSSIKSDSQGYSQTSVFETIDISRPEAATVVASIEIPTNIKGLAVAGASAYIIGAYPYRLAQIDISSPTKPKLIPMPESIAGSADYLDIAIANGIAFLADGFVGLRVVDITDPQAPKHLADLDLQGSAFNIYRSPDRLYVGVEQKYFSLADVRDVKAPTITYTKPFTASYKYTSVVMDKTLAFFNGGGAHIYDIANPKMPVHLNKGSAAEIDSIQVHGNYLYSSIGEIGLLVYDISNPAVPVKISQTPFPAGIPRDLSVHWPWAVGISNVPYSITVFNITDAKKPVAGEPYMYQTYPQAVTVRDGYVYVARGESGTDILQIQPNGALKLVTTVPTTGNVHHVIVSGNRAYVVRDGADIYDVINPGKPVYLAHVSNRDEANHLAVTDDYIYIADGHAGVTIVPTPK